MKKNNIFFAGLEDDEEQFEEATFVDQNLDDDGEIEPVITEEDVPEDGKSPDADVVSVEDFDHFFNSDNFGFEDDEEAAIDEGDGGDETPTVNVSVDIETGDDDGEDVGDDYSNESDDESNDVSGEESYDIFGFEDDDPVDQAAEVSDDGEGDDTETVDESDEDDDSGDDDDISVDVNINVNVDDGTSGDDGDDTGAEEPATDSGEISQEDFDFGTMGLEDDTPEVNVEVTVDGEEQETVSTTDDGDDTETTSDDPVDQAAELSDDGEGSEEPDPDEAGTEEDEEDDLGEESFFGDLW